LRSERTSRVGDEGAPQREERARLFVALELPQDAREALERWRASALRRSRGLRLVDPAALHVTLCFLGWRGATEVEEIGSACAAAIGGWEPLELSPGDPVWLPQRRPRSLAVRIDDQSDGLSELQASLSRALSSGGWYAPESRPFLGHATVARIPRGSRARAVKLPGPPASLFSSERVTLYRSRLGPGGARYEAQRTIELGRKRTREASTGTCPRPSPGQISPIEEGG
jgi:2'-5' RNA ligase